MEKMKWLMCCLVVLTLVLGGMRVDAATIVGGTVTVGSGDLLAGQSDSEIGTSGFNFRYSYGAYPDKYYQNGNNVTPDQTGWESAMQWHSANAGHNNAVADGYGKLMRISGPTGLTIYYQWHFDFTNTGQLIDKLVFRVSRWHWIDGAADVQTRVLISLDGNNWTQLANDVTNGVFKDMDHAAYYDSVTTPKGSFFDATSLVKGAKEYYVQVQGTSVAATVIGIFCGGPGWGSREFSAFDNQVTLKTPNSCADVWTIGAGLPEDLNQDCVIDFKDFAIVAESWMVCNAPADPNCQ